MRRGFVYANNVLAGIIEYSDEGWYSFRYDDTYFNDPKMPGISLTLPKKQKKYESNVLFPFFYDLLAEGINKEIQCRLLKIDEEDDFTRLLKTAAIDTIGAVSIHEEIKY